MGLQRYTVGEVKRMVELWTASPELRKRVEDDRESLIESYGRFPTMGEFSAHDEDGATHPDVKAWDEFLAEKLRYRSRIKQECAPKHPGFRAWRTRQINRHRMENGSHTDDQIIHTPLAIEYSRGCSVQCWYCGVDAIPLERVFEYSEENAKLHRDILEVCLDRIGPATKRACSYWATDPLDNPDYERFMDDFHELCGMYPQTTTGQAHRHIERLKKLLPDSEAKGQYINRFSIQNLRELDIILREFSADELVRVELIFQQPQATDTFKANAGKFYRLALKNEKLMEREKARYVQYVDDRLEGKEVSESERQAVLNRFILPGTNSCMTGFWVNMVDRFIRLVSPTAGSPRWPGGWIQFDEVHFDDAADFERQIDGLIERNMPELLPDNRPVKFLPGVEYRRIDRGFDLSTAHETIRVQAKNEAESFEKLGSMIDQGKNTPEEICLVENFASGRSTIGTFSILNSFFDSGYLQEEPDENLFEKNPDMRGSGQ